MISKKTLYLFAAALYSDPRCQDKIEKIFKE